MSLMDKAVALALPAVPKPIVGFFSKRYIAGSTRDDAFRVVRELEREGAMATLDILGEFISSLDQADANTRAYVDLVRQVAAEKLTATNVSVKLTALGLLLDTTRCVENMRMLVCAAAETDGFVRIDMEDAQCTDRTLAIYRTLRAEFPGRVGVVLQARLRRTLDDVDTVTEEPANLRLCKGIYPEPRRIAYTDAEIIRDNFTWALERMFERKAYVGIATHDERIVWEALRLIRRFGLAFHHCRNSMDVLDSGFCHSNPAVELVLILRPAGSEVEQFRGLFLRQSDVNKKGSLASITGTAEDS